METKTNNTDSARLKRIETRLSNFMRWLGYDPSREVAVELATKLTEDNGTLHATNPNVTVGDVAQAAYRFKLEGEVPLYLNGIQLGVFNVGRNFDREQ